LKRGKEPWIAALVLAIGLALVTLASYQGWGAASEDNTRLQRGSVRGGSLHSGVFTGSGHGYRFFGRGPGFGK